MAYILDGKTRIHDIFHDDDIPPSTGSSGPSGAGRSRADLGVAVARELQEINLAVDLDFPDQVGEEYERAVQYADEDGDCPR